MQGLIRGQKNNKLFLAWVNLTTTLIVRILGETVKRKGLIIFFLSVFAGQLYAAELPDKDWVAYFSPVDNQVVEYRIIMATPFGTQQGNLREKQKGTVEFDGKRYLKSVVVMDFGPMADKVTEVFTLISEKGKYERRGDETERLLVPRPLSSGEIWQNGEKFYRFEGIEDFETFDASVPNCVKITVINQNSEQKGKMNQLKAVKYYEKGKGLIYKSGSNNGFTYTKIRKEYSSSYKD